MSIKLNKKICIGCGVCAALCSDNFAMEDSGKAKIVKNNGAEKLIISKLGMNASMALDALKVKTFKAPEGKILVKDLVALYLKGKIKMTPSEDLIFDKFLK